MKKIFMFGLLTFILSIGIGTTALAHNSNNSSDNNSMLDRALPFIKEMHPNPTEQEIKNMYDICLSDHGQALNNMTSTKNSVQNESKIEPNHRQLILMDLF
ncbi:hypothetical protein [Bacillus thermotolerans]|uniref:Uncharacterized protein n=1 Tax=Bacillus thermotolerans TaxID=1221996 RepID=A0A0F5HMV8_BACTR|nr:hypothetical protein [Bacillus thermotolerans]KKB34719.1 hypothetical protein QY95_03831 [Bacillus thermotolerans]KKB38766.1 hypothetical protein QY96_02893 [Bacillus thermotolerans]